MIRTVLALVFSATLLAGCSTTPPPVTNPDNAATAIDSFGATPNPSPINVGVSFSWTVAGSNLTCTLDAEGDGTIDYTVQNCTSQSRVIHNYGTQGAFTAHLAVSGADGQSKSQVTLVTVGAANLPPTIPTLQPQLVASGDSLEVTFVWIVDDRNADITHCQFDADSDGVLDYDNLCSGLPTTSAVKPSATVNHIFKYKYSKRGRYTATLRASDPYSSTTSSVRLRAPLNTLPAIDTFTATAGPNNTASLAFRVSDADDDSLSCKLMVESIGSFNYPTCRNLTRNFTFGNAGKYRATLEVSDGLQMASKTAVIDLSEDGPPPLIIESITAGADHTCALTTVGRAFCWGNNRYGQLGHPANNEVSPEVPNPLPTEVGGGLAFESIEAGRIHTCGLTSNKEAYCWGSNRYGQLGSNTNTGQQFSANPTPLAVQGGLRFNKLVPGGDHTCGIATDNKVYCWGDNTFGQLGWTTTNSDNPVPTELNSPLSFISIFAGQMHTCGIVAGGISYCWGRGLNGSLGSGTNSSETPLQVGGNTWTIGFEKISAGLDHTCALTSAGAAYCWGGNYYGELGRNTQVNTYVAVPIPDIISGMTFSQLALELSHSCGLTLAGAAYCWGNNEYGQLGNGTKTNQFTANQTPTAVIGGHTYTQLAAGAYHVCGLTPDHKAYCWGRNNRGQMGNATNLGTDAASNGPVLVDFPN